MALRILQDLRWDMAVFVIDLRSVAFSTSRHSPSFKLSTDPAALTDRFSQLNLNIVHGFGHFYLPFSMGFRRNATIIVKSWRVSANRVVLLGVEWPMMKMKTKARTPVSFSSNSRTTLVNASPMEFTISEPG